MEDRVRLMEEKLYFMEKAFFDLKEKYEKIEAQMTVGQFPLPYAFNQTAAMISQYRPVFNNYLYLPSIHSPGFILLRLTWANHTL